MKKRKVCIITGSRAEWGLLYPLAKEINRNKGLFNLEIITTGAHLSNIFGLTYKEIERDGFKINYKVKIPLTKDTAEAIVMAVSLGITRITKALRKLEPDLVFLLGDRFEIFAAATACLFLKIPIAHIHGGEVTQGSLDDSLRHAITKMAHLHFVSTSTYEKRVIQMGEDPKRVFNVGALGIDNIKNTKLLNKKELESRLKFKLGRNNILVAFNSATLEKKDVLLRQLQNLLKAVDSLDDTRVIFTKPNPDLYSKSIIAVIDSYVAQNRDKAISFVSLGRVLYLSLLKQVDLVIGNSSSGIIEVPSFGIPTINIGSRQEGRIMPSSVINAKGALPLIKDALNKALSEKFRKFCKKTKNPYGKGKAAVKIVKILKKATQFNLKKSFLNLDFKTN